MRTNFLNAVMPAAVMALGLVGAFGTDVVSKSATKSGAILGYKHVDKPIPCESVAMCSDSGTSFCVVSGQQLYEFNGATCPRALRREF